eukprot:INCI18355.2.p2 GENE.INCI18355.2~~INCI18355.2.p2  ORF type:complete len:132 (+),score=20.64 INCI18355.2:296-691(+)
MAQRVDARDVSASMAAVGLEQFLLFIGLAEHIPLFTAEYRDLDHLVDCAEAFETRRDFSEAFPFLTPVQERRLKRHLDATAMGFGGFGIWGENRRKHGPGGPDDPPPALDLPAYISEIEGTAQVVPSINDI